MSNPDPKAEAAFVSMRESIPRMWWNLYQGCLEAGFDKSQSMSIVIAHVMGLAAGKIVPPNPDGPDSDKPAE